MKWLGIFLLLFATLQAQEGFPEIFDITTMVQNECLEAPPPAFSSMESATFFSQIPKVNVITGEYSEEECDLVIAGIEPISYRRFYGHQGAKNQAYGHWKINPECQMWFSFDCPAGTKHFKQQFAIGKATGSCYSYAGKSCNQSFYLDNVSSLAYPALTGQHHPFNVHINYAKHGKVGEDFYYDGTIEEGDGCRRFFSTEKRYWPIENNAYTDVQQAPPYQALIHEERRPNGNLICYEYKDYNSPLGTHRKYPHYYVLESIKAYNSTGEKELGYLNIEYDRYSTKHRVKEIRIIGSDKRSATCCHALREVRAENQRKNRGSIHDVVLSKVEAPGKPIKSYQYHWDHAKHYFDHPFMFEAQEGNGRLLKTDYNFSNNKVIAQSAPVGPEGQFCPIARYEYFSDHTMVYDAENNKIIYRFECDSLQSRLSKVKKLKEYVRIFSDQQQLKTRIIAVEKYQNNALYSIERNEWDPKTGNLIKVQIEDAAGNIFRKATYKHDEKHNVIEQTIGDYTIFRTFTPDHFNLVITEEDGSGRKTCYDYKPGTNLLTSELVYGRIKLRNAPFIFTMIAPFASKRL